MEKMIKERHGRFIRFLSDILLLFACCLFLISVAEPFLTSVVCFYLENLPRQGYAYWSFQATFFYVNKTYTFNNYWFSHNGNGLNIQYTNTPGLLLMMFLMQILTVAAGLLSLGLRKRWVRLVPFVSSATITLLMIDIHRELTKDYGVGYWLVYPSTLLFLLAFTMSLTGLKNMPAKSLYIGSLKKALAAFGCSLFLISLVFPFYYEWGTSVQTPVEIHWSYMSEKGFPYYSHYLKQYWFCNYWFTEEDSALSWTLISMFIIQVLILVFGIASFIFSRRILSFLPALLCLGVLGLMIYAGQTLMGSSGRYELGYDLVYPSLVIFLSVFALNEVAKKRQASEIPTPLK